MNRPEVIDLLLPQIELPEWRLRLEQGTDRAAFDRRLPSDPQPDRDLRASLIAFGQLQPIGVRATGATSEQWGRLYQIVFGRRRLEQAKRAGAVSIAASVIDVDEDGALLLAIQENHARRDHNAAELARALSRLKRSARYTLPELAAATSLPLNLCRELVIIDRQLCAALRPIWYRYGDRLPQPARLAELARIAALPDDEQTAEWDRVCGLRAVARNRGGRPNITRMERAEAQIAELDLDEDEKRLMMLGAALVCGAVKPHEIGFAHADVADRRALAAERLSALALWRGR
jgi:hypothetical protein